MSKRRLDFAGLGPSILVLLCIAIGLSLDNYPQYVLAIAMVSMLVGIALVIVVGLGRCITLASGSIMAIGAYASTVSVTGLGLPYTAALLLAGVAGAAAGWLIALPGTRFRGHNLAMVTLVFQSVCIILIREAKWFTGGAQGIRVPTPEIVGWKIVSDGDYLIVIGILTAVMVLVLTILVRGPFGKNLQAAAGNEVAAEAFGVSVSAYITAAFVVSSSAIALAGALAAPRIRILDPESFGVMLSISMLAYPIVGGMNSIWGGLLGGWRHARPAGTAAVGRRISGAVLCDAGDRRRDVLSGRLDRAAAARRRHFRQARRQARFCAGCNGGRAAAAPTAPAAEPSEKPLMLVEAIDKHFDALHAVNSANLIVSVGGIHGLIGPNGAGKTSLFNIISGFLDADRGHVEFAGTSLLELQARDRIRLGITRTFQHVAVFGQLSCVDNVVIGRGRNAVIHSMNESFGYFVGGAGATAARREALVALDSVGLASQAYSPAGALSLGDQRRLEIARAIVSNPRLIMLDEPVSGVAESEVEELRQLLLRINAERKIAMLVVEHNIPFVAQLCRTMSVMGAGCIVAEGTPADVISLPTVRQLYFGEEISQ